MELIWLVGWQFWVCREIEKPEVYIKNLFFLGLQEIVPLSATTLLLSFTSMLTQSCQTPASFVVRFGGFSRRGQIWGPETRTCPNVARRA